MPSDCWSGRSSKAEKTFHGANCFVPMGAILRALDLIEIANHNLCLL
jgi:hypothetical protein